MNRAVGKALHDYQMISDGDRIAVGLSGGKDSLSLMRILAERQARIPVHYELYAIYLDPGFDGGFSHSLENYCRENGYSLTLELTDYGVQGHSRQNLKNPCFLCSRLRRKRLFEIAAELGCKKLALGHTRDDIIETLFLNMFYSGQISTMLPAQPMFEGRLTVIRPLAYVEEEMTRAFSREKGFPQFINPCPSAKNSKRQEIRSFLEQLYRSDGNIKGNIFRSLSNVRTEYLFK